MLISDPKDRANRVEMKRRLVLRFLREETWTTVEVLGPVVGLETRQAVHKTLMQMEQDKLVRQHIFPIVGRKVITVWGITAHGLALSWEDNEPYEDRPHFEPARLVLSRLPHQLSLQKVRLAVEKSGWSEWVRGERLGFKSKIRPDAIVTRPDGLKVAIEVELTIKTKIRYRVIIREHLMKMRKGEWHAVIYLSNYAPRLHKIFDSIDYVPLMGEKLQLNETHKKRFRILGIDSLSDWLSEGKNQTIMCNS